MDRFIVTDNQEGDIEGYETLDKAKAGAEEVLDHYRTNSGDGWPDNLDIKISEVLQESMECNRRPVACGACENPKEKCECEEFEPEHEFNYTCDYQFFDVLEVPENLAEMPKLESVSEKDKKAINQIFMNNVTMFELLVKSHTIMRKAMPTSRIAIIELMKDWLSKYDKYKKRWFADLRKTQIEDKK